MENIKQSKKVVPQLEEEYEEVVNWKVVLPILIIMAIAVLYVFLW